MGKDGSPFRCECCTERDKVSRNCANRIKLTERARAVTEYTEEVIEELADKGAQKVFTLGKIRLYECPLSYLSEDTIQLMRVIFLIDETRKLLHPGGWGEQPTWLVEAFEVFKAEATKTSETVKTHNQNRT